MDSFSWGTYPLPLAINTEDFSLNIELKDDSYYYLRKCKDEQIKKLIFANDCMIHISPTEPLNKPKDITPYLLIDLDKPLVIDPKTSSNVMVTFPIEITCNFLNKEQNTIDIFTLSKPKFTLYGSISKGLICKYWKSNVYFNLPDVEPTKEGIMEINIYNNSNKWAEVNKIVFSAYGMKIYYNKSLVYQKASMKIINEFTAETTFFEEPFVDNMSNGVEIYSTKRLSFGASMIMEEGY